MSHTRYRRIGTIVAAGAIALATGAVGANAASAYPTPTGAATGSCSPSTQSIPVKTGAANVTCTFVFENSANKPAAGEPVTFKTSGGTVTGTGTTDASGSVSATLSPSACGASTGTTNYTVTANVDSGDALTTTQGFASVTCVLATPTVTAKGCTYVGPSGTFDGYDQYACSFATNVKDGTAVSYSVDDPEDGSFVFKGTKAVSGGAFSTTVYVTNGDRGVTLTGYVAATATSSSASATDTVVA